MKSEFQDIDSMWIAALAGLFDHGQKSLSRNGDSLDCPAYQGFLMNPDKNFLRNSRRKLSATYAAAELLWAFSRKSKIEGIVEYAPQYVKFAEDGIAHGAYGYRWAHNCDAGDQFNFVYEALRQHVQTRQAVVTMWVANDLPHAVSLDKGDLPCTLSYQFLHRCGTLNMICTMRSNDIWLGFPYDVFINTCVQRWVANQLGYVVGWYCHQAGSLHLYEKHRRAAKEALGLRAKTTSHAWKSIGNLENASMIEEQMRTELYTKSEMTGFAGTMAGDLVTCVADRWGINLGPCHSEALESGRDHNRRN